jgi:hypothetical protein
LQILLLGGTYASSGTYFFIIKVVTGPHML